MFALLMKICQDIEVYVMNEVIISYGEKVEEDAYEWEADPDSNALP